MIRSGCGSCISWAERVPPVPVHPPREQISAYGGWGAANYQMEVLSGSGKSSGRSITRGKVEGKYKKIQKKVVGTNE